jgi:PAS domain S-box-containing protein
MCKIGKTQQVQPMKKSEERYADDLFSDFTEQARADEALRRERDFISAVLDTAGALVVVLDPGGRILCFNRACERATGYSFHEVRGKLLWDLFLIPEEVAPVKTVFEELQAGQFPNEYENHWVTKRGDRQLIAWSNTALMGADGRVEYVIGTGIDVTERRQAESQRDATLEALKKAHQDLELRVVERTAELRQANQSLKEEIAERRWAEEALRQSEGHMRSLMESARSYAVYRIAVDPTNPFLARVVHASPSMKELLSIPDLQDFATWFDKIHPDDLARIVDANRCSLETGVPFDQQFRVFSQGQGEWAWVHVRSTPVFDDEGRLTHFNGLVADVTEQKRAEEALRESEEKFRGIVEYANVGIAIVQGACFRFVNPHYAAMLGYTVEELLDTEFMGYCAPEERDRVVDFYTRRVRGEPVPSRYETAILHKNGGRVYVDVSAGIIPYGGQPATFVFLRDITEQKQAKQAIEEAYQTLEQRVGERTKELAVLNSIAAVVSGSLDLKEIMSAALAKTSEAMDMEFGTAYCLECNREQALEISTPKPDNPNAVAQEIVKQTMLAPQETPSQTRETDHLRLLAYRGVSADYAEFVSDVRLPGAAMALACVGKPFVWLVEDIVPADTDLRQFLEREGCRQVVTLPLIAKGNLAGAINLGTRAPRTFTSDQLSLLSAVGQQIGMAVENACLYEAEQERWEEAEGRRRVAEGMREILAVLNSRQSLQETLDFIAAQTCRLLGSDAAAILRLEDGLLRIQAACGLEADYISGVTLRLGEGGAGRALAARQPVVVSDLAEAALLTPEHEIPPEPQRSLIERLFREYRAILSVPLIVQGQDYGAITVYYPGPREFSEEDLGLAMSVADQVALAIENARLREQAGQAAAVEERGRLARELHDSVTQSLYSVTMYAEAAARLLTSGQQATAAEYLRDARDTAQEALREMRLLIYQLRPPVLEKGGLAVALQVRLDAVERRGGIQAELHIEGQDRLPPTIQAELHQIAQEALNNALKHAHARKVQVQLHFGEAATCLGVQDDGVGFDLAAARDGGGLGIPGMKERVQKIGGRLEIKSAPGQGTKILVEVPTGGEA